METRKFYKLSGLEKHQVIQTENFGLKFLLVICLFISPFKKWIVMWTQFSLHYFKGHVCVIHLTCCMCMSVCVNVCVCVCVLALFLKEFLCSTVVLKYFL